MQRDAAHPTSRQRAAETAKSASTLLNRNVTVAGHRTSIRLEPAMWEALQQVCTREHKPLNELVTEVERQRVESSLTAAIRVYLLHYFQAAEKLAVSALFSATGKPPEKL
jgi:predicted DNA-binding ribbon-helix-helix protein